MAKDLSEPTFKDLAFAFTYLQGCLRKTKVESVVAGSESTCPQGFIPRVQRDILRLAVMFLSIVLSLICSKQTGLLGTGIQDCGAPPPHHATIP